MVSSTALQDPLPGQDAASRVEISRLYNLSLLGRYTVEASKAVPSPSGQGLTKVVSNRLEFEVVATPEDVGAPRAIL